MQGVNVIARWIDPSSGLPSRVYAAAAVSGFLFVGNAGNEVTGFKDPQGLPFNRYGSNDITLEGFFDLAGLQIPNGAASAQYQLTAEALDPLWSAPVGPYDPMQIAPSGTAQAILVNVELGSDSLQDIVMQNTAKPAADPFPLTSYANPATVPLGGDWVGSLSPYGDLDYFRFQGQGNRTLSVLVTALDETGAASEVKAQPVIGMWGLSDPPEAPAPANTPSAFNSAYFGMTMLQAQLLQRTGFRIGISDYRGDGRPDYRYHARILYGDNVSPLRASSAGGTPLAINGLGFQANTRVSVSKTNVVPLAATASQLLISAPTMSDGQQDITLVDPPTSASSIMSGAVLYGAGPNDILKLLSTGSSSAPVGGQAPTPVQVQVLAPDGVTPVQGASVFFTSSPAAGMSACAGATSCAVFSDQNGMASTFVTLLSPGTTVFTAKLAPASYPSPKQVQLWFQGTESALDIALAPQRSWIAQGANATLTLTARVLSNGSPVSGKTVNFQVMRGSGLLSPLSPVSDANGYASTTLQVTSFAGDLQISACVAPQNAPCLSFYGIAVPASEMQILPGSGNLQVAPAGHSFQPVVVRVTDLSSPPNPVTGATIAFPYVVERSDDDSAGESGGDTNIGPPPDPIILYSSQGATVSDSNGLAPFTPEPAASPVRWQSSALQQRATQTSPSTCSGCPRSRR
jgi:hypothetical protein